MPEELFSDLPDNQAPAEEVKEEVKEEKREDEIQKLRDLVKEKDKIAKEERERRKKLAEENRNLKAKIEKPEEQDEDEPKVEAQPAPVQQEQLNKEELVATIKSSLKQEQYQEQLIGQIKLRPGITRAEANEILEICKKLPQTGDAELDVDFAFDYKQKLKKRESGFTPPSIPSGYSAVRPSQSAGQITPGMLEVGKQHGLTKQDFEKYSGGISI